MVDPNPFNALLPGPPPTSDEQLATLVKAGDETATKAFLAQRNEAYDANKAASEPQDAEYTPEDIARIKVLNGVRTQTADSLAAEFKNDDAEIVAAYRKNQAIFDTDPDVKAKFFDAYKAARSKPFSPGATVVGFAKGLYHLVPAIRDSGEQALTDIFSGEGDKVFQGSVYAANRTGEDAKEAGVAGARLLKGFFSHLDVSTLPRDEAGWEGDFEDALRRDKHLDDVAHGNSSLAKYTDKEAGDVVKNSLVADPMNVALLAAGAGVSIVMDVAKGTQTGVRVYKLVNKAGQVIREIPGASRAGEMIETMQAAAKTASSKAIVGTGRAIAKTGEALGGLKGTVVGGAIDSALGATGHAGIITGSIAPKMLEFLGNQLTDIGLKTQGRLPWGGFVKTAQAVAESPIVQAGVDVTKAGIKGGFHALGAGGDPLTAVYTAQTLLANADGDGGKLGEALGGNFGFGVAGAIGAKGAGAIRQYVNDHQGVRLASRGKIDAQVADFEGKTPEGRILNDPEVLARPSNVKEKILTATKSPGYGIDENLDLVNAETLRGMNPAERENINQKREFARGKGEIYALTSKEFLAQLINDAVEKNGGNPLSDEQAKQIATSDAFTKGVFIPDLKGKDGNPRKVVFLNADGSAGGHETGHLVDALLSPEDRASVREKIASGYSAEEIAAFKASYEKKLGREIPPESVIDELVAENFDKLLAGVPADQLGAPRQVSTELQNVLERAYSQDTRLGARPDVNTGAFLSKTLAKGKLGEAPSPEVPVSTPPEAVPAPSVVPKPVVGAPASNGEPVQPVQPDIQPAEPSTVTGPTGEVIQPVVKGKENIRVTPAEQSVLSSQEKSKRGLAPEDDGTVSAQLALQDPRNGYTPLHKRIFEQIKSLFGKPIEALYNSVQSDKYAADREIRAEERAVPEAARETVQKITVPYRTEVTGTGEIQVLSKSPDKVLANLNVLARELVVKGATDLSPYPIEKGKFSTDTTKALVTDLQNYLTNQTNGYGGNGQRVAVPKDYYGSVPAENPNYKPVIIAENKAQFLNTLMGADLAPPKTARKSVGRDTPANVSAVQLAKFNARPVTPSARAKPGQVFGKEFGNALIQEPNPLRQRMLERGVSIEGLHAVTERLTLAEFKDVKARPDVNFAEGSTDLQRAGFMPGGKGTAEFLYAETFKNRAGETKTVRYYQIPDAERARGMTVDEDTAKADGYLLGQEPARSEGEPIRSKEGTTKSSLGEDTRQFSPNPNPETQDVARQYVEDRFGRDYVPHDSIAELPEPQLRKIADHFQSEAKHDPSNPEVQKSYAALIDETKAQYKVMLAAGIKVEAFSGKGEPYKSSAEMMTDVRDNKHLTFFLTDNGFGAGDEAPNHPLLEKTGIMLDGRELLANDLFRVVHDYFGHTQQGFQFGPKGEYNAWRSHSEMFSPEAQSALAAETLAQNAWVNFGPHLRDASGKIPAKGESGYVPPQERPFAGQKAYALPEDLIKSVRPDSRQFSPSQPESEGQLPSPLVTTPKELVPKGGNEPLPSKSEASISKQDAPQENIPRSDGGRGGFRVDDNTGNRRRSFRGLLQEVHDNHPAGKAVTVKDAAFYDDPKTKLFLAPDNSAGVAVSGEGELVSVFKKVGSSQKIGPLLEEAAQYATHLDAYTSGNGYLPNLYAQLGFKAVARVPFDSEQAPTGWPKETLGAPDVVFMVKDPENKLGLPSITKETPYNVVEKSIPSMEYGAASQKLQEALIKLKASADSHKLLDIPGPESKVASVRIVPHGNRTPSSKDIRPK